MMKNREKLKAEYASIQAKIGKLEREIDGLKERLDKIHDELGGD